jgi:hypothetical protein
MTDYSSKSAKAAAVSLFLMAALVAARFSFGEVCDCNDNAMKCVFAVL